MILSLFFLYKKWYNYIGDNMHWQDLYIKDYGTSQVEDEKELKLYQKKMKSFYKLILEPLYIPLKRRSDFKFSVEADKLTIRIMYKDLMEYYNLKTSEDVLNKIGEFNPDFVPKIKPLLERIEENKERKTR